jgi:DHA3 family macrolide efflux protein-like MFS transporter
MSAQAQEKSMKTFLTIWVGQVLSSVGTVVGRFAIIWWIASLTGSATALAMATLMSEIPRVVLSPVAGALVDRWDRKRVLIISDGVIALLSLALAVLFWTGQIQVWHVYVVMLLRAVVYTFNGPAMLVVTGLLVPDRHLTRVAGMNQTLHGALGIVGPMLGALLLAVLPLEGIMLIDVATAALAIVPLVFVRVPRPTAAAAKERQSVLADLREGLEYVRAWPGLLYLLVGAAVARFVLIPAFSLAPLLITNHFGGGALELGWLESGFGFGVIAGGLALSVWGGFKKKIWTVAMGTALAAVGLLSVGVAPATALLLALAGLFVVGASVSFIDGPITALLQATVSPEMQGRVFTLVLAISGVSAPLGLAIAGPVADRIGVQTIYIISAAVFIGVAAAFGTVKPLMRIEEDGTALRERVENGGKARGEAEAAA